MRLLYFTIISIFIISACKSSGNKHNTLTKAEVENGWELLFDGSTLNGWHLYNHNLVLNSDWNVINGEIVYSFDSSAQIHEDLITNNIYENFEFTFDWKISPYGNSGVFINIVEREDIPTAWASGLEYQIIDSLHEDYQYSNRKMPGVLYNLTEQKSIVTPKPAGEWNSSKIIQINGQIEFYLNDVLTTKADLNSQEWNDLVEDSSFAPFPDFGKTQKGKIGLQGWENKVWFRNLKVREL